MVAVSTPEVADSEEETTAPSRAYPLLLIICGAIGFVSAMVLTIERIHLLQDPEAKLSCDISPFVACGPVMSSPAGALFGFPNPLLGIGGFAVVITVGAALLSGARFANWFKISFAVGTLLSAVFITWLQSQSLYVIGKLCPWCMLVWAITIPIVASTIVRTLADGSFGDRARSVGQRLAGFQISIIAIWYLIVIAAIGLRFYRDFALFWFGVAL
ncbi:vitamin K epoxide reductase family protein [Microlunatus speluncae]|uniref:vitamin K epoxide reductase family protein n=1 Tax=Microlunatus speluncae TaxID=2594267 RepID=UPI0012663CB8|nr:vitamin K epoxide reductase family protein [Microlunatus speluncae]